MVDASKLVTAIVLGIIGLIVAAWGIIYMWLHRNDTKIIEESLAKGEISATDAARLSSSTWWWVLSIIQVILGVGLIFWGIFQYFSGVEKVVTKVKEYAPQVQGYFQGLGQPAPVTETTTITAPVDRPRVGATSRRNVAGHYQI